MKRQKNPRWKYQRRSQKGGFLNRYDFAYAGRDTVNQVGKIARGLIKNASAEINNIAQQGINQIVRQGGKEAKRAFQKFLEGPLKMCIKHPSNC